MRLSPRFTLFLLGALLSSSSCIGSAGIKVHRDDAGHSQDSGLDTDLPDAGPSFDAGSQIDSGTDAGETETDAGVDGGTQDAGIQTDGGPDAGLPLPAWPAFGGVSPSSPPVLSSFAAPGYLDFTVDPRTQAFNDGRLLTEVARVSDGATFNTPATTRFTHQYAKVSPWNADNSEAMLFAFGATASAIIVDGKTFSYRRTVTNVYTGGRWSTVDPKLYFQVGAGWTPRLDVTDVTTSQRSIVKNFAADGYVESSHRSMFGGEGNQSTGDRIWAFQMRHQTRGWEIVVWDKQTDSILGHVSMPDEAGSGGMVDYWAISPKGNFLITFTQTPWIFNGITIPFGPNVWSLEGAYLRSMPRRPASHLDFCLDTEGHEVVAFIGTKYEANDKVGQTWRLDGSSGSATADQFVNGFIGWNFHISCASTARPGYMVISDYPTTTPNSYNAFPLWNQLAVVRLDGSLKVAVVANTHHDVTNNGDKAYERSSFGVANRDLSAIWFTASWDSVSAPIHSYVARPRIP